ncbi:hypothetical protein [Sphaerisporangium perillae]|uniref:hypothetical protein n=1 Tax=Sphaerisporangium perillae TaxID=2935860 RepID=UPI002010426D|nr:hypothetical protein [Sphaerisporangium perillae]
MSNVTRYLCAAAYLDGAFRAKVLTESLHDEFRAVPPSYGGFDLAPVIHHCRRSRTILLVRDVLIVLVLAVGFGTAFFTTIAWLTTLTPFALLTAARVRQGPLLLRGLIWAWALYSAFFFLLSAMLRPFFDLFTRSAGLGVAGLGGTDVYGLPSTPSPLVDVTGSFLGTLAVPLATLGVAVGYRIATYMTLAGSLKPGAAEPMTEASHPKVARRLDYIRRAQWGNITMYANEDAFMGAGTIQRVWSIAVELDRVRGADAAATGRRQSRPVDIDPLELHGFVRGRLVEMRDGVLRANESVERLDIGDHVVSRGAFTTTDWRSGRPAHPLIDQSGLPRHHATPEEIAAIIRHPQGGVRYYQRVTISGVGQEIRDASGKLVAPAEDQEALTSAFIHLAVEGRMLYTQFVVTVLPPADDLYHVVDRLPAMTVPRIAWEAVRALKLHLLRDVLAAPVRLVRAAWQSAVQGMTAPNPADHLVYQYGAHFSARELGASQGLQTHIQALDAAKYTKLIEQRLTEAVLDFLEQRGVDTGAYRLQAAGVTMHTAYTMHVGDGGIVSGPVSFGPNGSATVNNLLQPTG